MVPFGVLTDRRSSFYPLPLVLFRHLNGFFQGLLPRTVGGPSITERREAAFPMEERIKKRRYRTLKPLGECRVRWRLPSMSL